MSQLMMNNNLILGHARIDHDHRRLFDLIDQLATAMRQGNSRDVCAKVLDQLVTYTRTHFAMEELLMRQHRYPQALAHKAEHDGFVASVGDFQKKLQTGSSVVSLEMLTVLRDWLANHIQKTDKALVSGLAGA